MTTFKPHNLYPDIIRRDTTDDAHATGPWTISHDWDSGVNLKKRSLQSPLRDAACSGCGEIHTRAMNDHELAHVAFTPTDWREIAERNGHDKLLLEAVEDSRVSVRARMAGVDIGPTQCVALMLANADYLLAKGSVAGLMRLIASSASSTQTWLAMGVWHAALEDGQVKDLVGAAMNIVSKGIVMAPSPQFAKTLNTTDRLEHLIRYNRNALDGLSGMPAQGASQKTRAQGGLQESEQPFEYIGQELRIASTRNPGRTVVVGKEGWMAMSVQRAPLERAARRGPQRKYSARDEGAVPAGMHRYLTDGRIFHQRVRRVGRSAILVDMSGSMCWSEDEVLEILDASPATAIALYSASSRLQEGILRIVARNGRRCEAQYITPPSAHANGVDGPALLWLREQSGMRIWLSDGMVTGKSDGHNEQLLSQARAIVQRSKIMRVSTAEQCVAVATGAVKHAPGWIGNTTVFKNDALTAEDLAWKSKFQARRW